MEKSFPRAREYRIKEIITLDTSLRWYDLFSVFVILVNAGIQNKGNHNPGGV